MDFKKYFPTFFIARTIMAVALVSVGFFGLVLYSHNGKIQASPSVCRVENKQAVLVSECGSPVDGGLCQESFYKDVTFDHPYATVPHVIVTLNHISETSCAGPTTDKVQCYPSGITTTGFRLHCSGSPDNDACGAGTSAYRTPATANWMAVDSDASCSVQSGHGIIPTTCSVEDGGLCALGTFSTPIIFSTPFASTPNIIVAAEDVSTQDGCVEGTTDQVLCFPSEMSATGFTLNCSGSPAVTCETSEGFKSLAKAGWIAVANADQRKVQSQHALQTDECPGGISNQTCAAGFRKTVTFPEPFDKVPKVTVSPELVSDSSGVSKCAQAASDAYKCEAIDITAAGFIGVCWGSPEGDECGQAQEAYTTGAKFSYIAVESDDVPSNGQSCTTDADCPTNGFTGDISCQTNDVYQNYTTYICNNPGTASASCSSTVVLQKKQMCAAAQSCDNGGCTPEVW